MDGMSSGTFYDEIGGAETFRKIVHEFYPRVAEDPVLRPRYPEEDLGPAEVRPRMFLEQYWGGPTTYSALRGQHRLRMRLVPSRADRAAHDAWLRTMLG